MFIECFEDIVDTFKIQKTEKIPYSSFQFFGFYV
jgi:hypothetical protein